MKIKNIEIRKIHSHPDNPRKDLGDITELSQSIAENGIMQNLTVVEREDGEYTAIIGVSMPLATKARRTLSASGEIAFIHFPFIKK